MPFFDPIRIGASGAADDYTIDRSLRFNDNDTAYLTRTPSSAGNRKIWTLSVWVKRTTVDANQRIFTAYDGSNNNAECSVQFQSDGKIQINNNNTSSNTDTNLKTDRLFRDPSAWYHIVVATDMTQGTAANRVNLYINGEQETSFSTESYGTQDVSWWFANNSPQTIGRRPTSERYFDGYMAEFNFIDGLQLTPSSFGATDAITEQWNPKKYTGSYGTNGFYLNFSDNSGTTATTLGKDSSGNGNNFTPNNFSVSAGSGNDSLEDTPTNNFCTLNPLFNDNGRAEPNFSNANLDINNTGGGDMLTHGTFAVKSGKYYFEAVGSGVGFSFGSGTHFIGIQQEQPSNSVAEGLYRSDGRVYNSSASASDVGVSYSSGDVIGVAFDATTGKVWFAKNNTYVSSGDPANGNNPAFTWSTTNHITPALAFDNSSDGKSWVINFGQRAFTYTPPTGFEKLNSANLTDPTILLPNKHFDSLLWSGNSTNNRSITGLEFQPDWVWIKARTVSVMTHWIVDSLRPNTDNGTGNGNVGALASNSTDGEQAHSDGGFESFDANGFTLGKGSNDNNADSAYQRMNASGRTYVGWNWNAGDTDGKTYTVTVVSDSGNKFRFDGYGTSAVTLDLAEGGTYIFNYPSGHPFRFSTTSDGTHGGGSEYTTGVTHNSSTQVTIVVAASAPTLYYYCSSHSGMGGQVNTNSSLGSSNFDGSVQAITKVNTSSGFSIISWTGTGSNLTIGHGLGVKPSAHITKARTGSSGCPWFVYFSILGANSNLRLNTTAAVNSGSGQSDLYNDTEPTSSVITIGDSSCINENGGTYITYAFAEVAGYSKFGSYTGNGSADGTFVFTGFKPAWVMIKKSSGGDSWLIMDNKRDVDNAVSNTLAANSSGAENADTGGIPTDFLSNGFKCRGSGGDFNASGETFVYLAFAESPFKNARAR